jgi:bifunctional DNase/RNase
MAVEMELSRIIISEMNDQQMIMLKEVEGDRSFHIIIGTSEADAINRRVQGRMPPRPMTHELLADIIEKLGGSVERIEITDLQSGIYFARIHIRHQGRLIEIDSRPSDAIALGAATTVPIFVAEHVLNEACRESL